MHQLFQRHDMVVTIGGCPSAMAYMEDGLVVADWEIEYAALFRESIGTGVKHIRGTVVSLVEVKVKYVMVQTVIVVNCFLGKVGNIEIIRHF